MHLVRKKSAGFLFLSVFTLAMDIKSMPLRFRKVRLTRDVSYWTHRDVWYLPYIWLEERDVGQLPLPFVSFSVHCDSPVGTVCDDEDAKTNIIALPPRQEELALDSDLRKDLKRIAKLNADVTFREGRPGDLEAASAWFVAQFKESKRDMRQRMDLYLKEARWTAAFVGEELLGVHLTMEDGEQVYYLGCWWNREHKRRCIPTFLLHRDILDTISRGKRSYDLGIGDESYKKQWPIIERQSKLIAVVDEKTRQALGLSPQEVRLVEPAMAKELLAVPLTGAFSGGH